MPKRNEGPFPFLFRAAPDWRIGGMLTNGDPGSNPPNRPRMIVNMRLRGGSAVPRRGQAVFNGSAFGSSTARITHISDFNVATPLRLWIIGAGLPDVSAGAGYYVGHLDPEQDPEFQRAVYYSTETTPPVIASYDGSLYIGIGSTLNQLQVLRAPVGTENLQVAGGLQQTAVGTLGGPIRCMKEFDGKLFIGIDAGAGTSKIITFDGITLRDDKTAIDPPTCFGIFHVPNGGDALFVGFGSATNHIRYRPEGDGVSWTTVTPGAGTLDALDMLDVGGELYIASGNGAVWSYNGAALALYHTPASATAVVSLTEWRNVLFVLYSTLTATRVAKQQGGVWTDVVKDLTADFPLVASPTSIRMYRECLYAAAARDGHGFLYVAKADTPDGTWYQAPLTTTTTTSGAVTALLVA